MPIWLDENQQYRKVMKMKKLAAKVILILLSTSSIAQMNGRLLDTSCGSMSLFRDPLKPNVIHSENCINTSPGQLAIIVNDTLDVVHLTVNQTTKAESWRANLAYGEVYISIDDDGKISESKLPKEK